MRESAIIGGSLQDLLTPPQRLIKAKSESSVASLCSAATVMSAGHDHDEFCSDDLERNRSRSLEPLSGLAMWSDNIEYIDLQKEDRGLGFSILDYLDPSEAGSSVIVVRSVVCGGAAAADGRLAPGDRLVSVNGIDVSRASLATAVRAIKTAPKGTVTIGVAKPLPCSTVVGGEKANANSMQSSQKIEYFTKILRLIMSLHRDIMELQLQCRQDVNLPTHTYAAPKIKAEITMK
ncbi:Patj-like [Papilio xuthus]|uniref:Patj-like n=1 Tax=Papilio xuthus TaxID=66420 RepID=A0A0N1IN53_PAPXU|nr:Patj-like [Papilio xuthus]